ncbi:LrgB family protein [Marinilabiliaceae bacterium JC017]|nr:LrgB family protein [Marinilabiliaceae bacterium JC017]
MNDLLSQPVLHTALTLSLYMMARWIFKHFKLAIFNPVLLTIGALIAIMYFTRTSFDQYYQNTHVISFWLGPSVVALGVPLYLNLKKVKSEVGRIAFAMLMGSLLGIVSVVLLAWLFGGSKEVLLSLAPKSVTTPIAMEVSKEIGGIPPLTAAMVISVGIFGAMFGWNFMKLLRIKDSKAIGLAIGAASHGVGTAWIAPQGKEYSAFGGLGMALNGVITALVTPWIIPYLMEWLF